MKPKLQALLLADRIYQDKLTGKFIVAGIFNRLFFSRVALKKEATSEEGEKFVKVPGGLNSGSPYCYISIIDLQGEATFQLRYVDLGDETVLFYTNLTVRSTDRLTTVEVAVPLPNLPHPHEGVYSLELVHDNDPLGCFRVNVIEMSTPAS